MYPTFLFSDRCCTVICGWVSFIPGIGHWPKGVSLAWLLIVPNPTVNYMFTYFDPVYWFEQYHIVHCSICVWRVDQKPFVGKQYKYKPVDLWCAKYPIDIHFGIPWSLSCRCTWKAFIFRWTILQVRGWYCGHPQIVVKLASLWKARTTYSQTKLWGSLLSKLQS